MAICMQEQDGSARGCAKAYCIAYGQGTPQECERRHGDVGSGSGSCQNGSLNARGGCVPHPSPIGEDSEWASKLTVCQQASADVESSCDTEQSGWMQELNNVSRLAQKVTSGEQSVCGTVAAVSVGTKGALATFAMMCSGSVGRCREACDTASIPEPSIATEMRRQRAICERKGSEGKQAEERAVAASQNLAQAVQVCGNAIGGLEGAAQQHCARPENQNSPSCKISFGSPMPTPDLAGGGDFPSRGGINHPGVNGGNPSAGRLPMNLGDDSREEPMLGNPNANQPPAQAVGGQQQSGARNLGAMMGMGGAQPGGGAASGGRTGLSGMVSNILSGFFGGGGGAGGSGGGGSSWRNFFSGRSDSEIEKPAQQQTPDLRLFAPGGKFDPRKNRGIASKTIGRDGLAGPHDSVWKLVNNRYQVKRASLMP
ncbi:MAG: hypothetical protein ACK5Y2_08260 [Bdellovibrionales bacterium]